MSSDAFAPDFAERLVGFEPLEPPPPAQPDQAAVAAILRAAPLGPEVLLIERARRDGDRWSGQVALPGGKAEPEDVDLKATAIRETREEVGLELEDGGRALCRLPGLQARARGGPVGLFVTPYVFAIGAATELHLGPEAADAFWMPLGEAASGRIDHRHRYERVEGDLLLPAWRYSDRTIWGLTHHMLRGLIDLLTSTGNE
ncbi:MAG: NUDIX hydrolase [Planctomycetota bacterium]